LRDFRAFIVFEKGNKTPEGHIESALPYCVPAPVLRAGYRKTEEIALVTKYAGDAASQTPHTAPLELWGGIECTVVRVGESFHDQFQCGGHHERADEDLERVAALGIRTLRYPVSWERVCPEGDLSHCDWQWIDARMEKMRSLRIKPIVGLVHHGGGPRTTSLIDPEFPKN
jgi:hypothetical protein